jgi:CHAD domain-containing protein
MIMPTPPLAYTLPPHEKTSRGFFRVLTAISIRAQGLTRRSRQPVAESIHEGRLLIKRVRALLWFARPALDASAYARARTRLRKAAGLMADQRDLAVTQATLEKLARRASETRDRAALKRILRGPVGNPIAGKVTEKSLRQTLKKAVGILRQSADAIKRSAADCAEWPSPSQRLAKAFHAMRRAGKKARSTENDTDFHTWRKKAKRLLYQLELTQPEPKPQMARGIKRVAKLQDVLGEHHDCVVVEERLRHTLPLPPAARRVAVLLGKRKARLRKKARKFARRLKPPSRSCPD